MSKESYVYLVVINDVKDVKSVLEMFSNYVLGVFHSSEDAQELMNKIEIDKTKYSLGVIKYMFPVPWINGPMLKTLKKA